MAQDESDSESSSVQLVSLSDLIASDDEWPIERGSPGIKAPPESLSKKISEEDEDDAIQELKLTPKERALQGMSYTVLAGALFLLTLFGWFYISSESYLAGLQGDFVAICTSRGENPDVKVFCDKYDQEVRDDHDAAKDVFEFMKSFIPPIVTLVLGAHYVTKNNE